jgi:hypothetical protein
VSSKLRIRIGDVEIDYEGSEDFLKQELPQLLQTAMELHRASGVPGVDKDCVANADVATPQLASITTGTVAARLKVTSSADLLVAAAARLTLVAGKSTFTRQALLSEMQSASSYFKKSYTNNLTRTLSNAVAAGKLQETATGVYALSATTKQALEAQLANT